MHPRTAVPLLPLLVLLLVHVLGQALPGQAAGVGVDGDLEEEGAALVSNATRNSDDERVLSRRRRYVVFPRGSSIQLVAEFTVGSYVPLTTTIFTTGLTWGLAWRLPSSPAGVYLNKRAAGEDPDLHHRAALVRDLVELLDRLGLRGEHCVRRALCELQPTTRGQKVGIVHRLLQALLVPTGGSALELLTPPSLTTPQGPGGPGGPNGPNGLDEDLESPTSCRRASLLCPVSVLDLPVAPHAEADHHHL